MVTIIHSASCVVQSIVEFTCHIYVHMDLHPFSLLVLHTHTRKKKKTPNMEQRWLSDAKPARLRYESQSQSCV